MNIIKEELGCKFGYYQDGKFILHNEEGPAVIKYEYDLVCNPRIKKEYWFNHGNQHRINGPAVIYSDYIKGVYQIYNEEYFLNNKKHRIDGPATRNSLNGRILYESYSINDLCHRIDGPAYIEYDIDGKIVRADHFMFGKYITKKQFNNPGFIDAFILENS